jgi:hypothetical protein
MKTGSGPRYSFYKLPPSLEVALQRFGTWSDAQLLREQEDATATVPLYHYTGWVGLGGIVSSRHLRFFSHDQQDDTEEFQYSLMIALAERERTKTRTPAASSMVTAKRSTDTAR